MANSRFCNIQVRTLTNPSVSHSGTGVFMNWRWPPSRCGYHHHCGGLGQRVWERLVYDWLDEVLTPYA